MALSGVKPCSGSSGSEHSSKSSPEFSDLVLYFIEDDTRSREEEEEKEKIVRRENHGENVDEEDLEKIEMLKSLFDGNEDVKENEMDDKDRIRREVEIAIGGLIGSDRSFPGFKCWLMTQLREKGFDVGLCKTNWEKKGKLTAGDYEYIDVNLSRKCYTVEVSLSSEFDIARSTNQYSSLLEIFPMIFVGKVEEFKRIVKLMSSAITRSMKRMNLHLAPWRRNVYMQTKWFSSYKRTTNAFGTRKDSPHFSAESFFPKKFVGFEARHVKVYNCMDDYVGLIMRLELAT